MKLTTIVASLLLLTANATAQTPHIPGPLASFPVPFDVVHYDADIDLTRAPSRDMRGVARITLRWVPGATARYFGYHLRSLVQDSVLFDGRAVTPQTFGDSATSEYYHLVEAPSGAPLVDTSTIVIHYRGRMTDELGPGTWGGVGSSDSTLFAMGVGLFNTYVSATQHWLPVFDHPSDKATFSGRFRTVGGFVTASNGTLTTTTSGDTTIAAWSTSIPTATYLLTFATARYVAMDFGSDPVPMVVYARARDTVRTRAAFRLLPRMVRSFAERLVPYPFEKVGYANTPIGAMEHQTMISFPIGEVNRTDSANYIAAHELAHQWFGDLVTPVDYRHVWLTEAFATYGESMWEEELNGFRGYLAAQDSKLRMYLNNVAPSEGILPLYDFPRAQPSSNYPTTIYQKGAVVVGMLRWEMGDSAFFAALRDYLTTHAFGTATSEDLRTILEHHHGASLAWFFEQWVYGRGWPELTVRATREPIGGGLERVRLAIAQTPTGEARVYRRLAVPVALEGAGDTVSRVVVVDSASQTAVLDSVPEGRVIRLNRGMTLRSLFRAGAVSGVGMAAPDSGAIEFRVRPNPTDGSAALTVLVLGADECAGIRYELYDSSGRRVGTGTSDACEFTIPTDGIASGAYVLRFRFREVFHDVAVAVAR